MLYIIFHAWNTISETSFEQWIYILKTEGQECKTDPVQGWVLVVGGRVNREGEGGWIWSCIEKCNMLKLF
jgi:hypothetical protein